MLQWIQDHIAWFFGGVGTSALGWILAKLFRFRAAREKLKRLEQVQQIVGPGSAVQVVGDVHGHVLAAPPQPPPSPIEQPTRKDVEKFDPKTRMLIKKILKSGGFGVVYESTSIKPYGRWSRRIGWIASVLFFLLSAIIILALLFGP